jgi:hypothetical protein
MFSWQLNQFCYFQASTKVQTLWFTVHSRRIYLWAAVKKKNQKKKKPNKKPDNICDVIDSIHSSYCKIRVYADINFAIPDRADRGTVFKIWLFGNATLAQYWRSLLALLIHVETSYRYTRQMSQNTTYSSSLFICNDSVKQRFEIKHTSIHSRS